MSEHKDWCPAPEYFSGEEKQVFINKTFSLTIGDIVTTSIDGVETKHGWGLNLVNFRGNKNRSYAFRFCPWCGAEVSR